MNANVLIIIILMGIIVKNAQMKNVKNVNKILIHAVNLPINIYFLNDKSNNIMNVNL